MWAEVQDNALKQPSSGKILVSILFVVKLGNMTILD